MLRLAILITLAGACAAGCSKSKRTATQTQPARSASERTPEDVYAEAATDISFGDSRLGPNPAAYRKQQLERLKKGLPIAPDTPRQRILLLYWRDRLPSEARDRFAAKCVDLADSMYAGTWKPAYPEQPTGQAVDAAQERRLLWSEFRRETGIRFLAGLYDTAFNIGNSLTLRTRASLRYQAVWQEKADRQWKEGIEAGRKPWQESSRHARLMRRPPPSFGPVPPYDWDRRRKKGLAEGRRVARPPDPGNENIDERW